MKNKKLLIIIGVILVIAIGIITYLSLRPKPQTDVIPEARMTSEEIQIKNKINEVVNTWGNFDDNTSQSYLGSIKPYLTDEAFAAQQEVSESQKYFNDQAGTPLKQKYTIKDVELVEHNQEDGDILTYKISATREFADQAQDSITYVKYQKIDDEWKIISIDSD